MLRRVELLFGAIAHRKRLAVMLAGLAPLVVRAALLPWIPAPIPRVHDEFSHLLVADTFAHGRLVNPLHPLWPHFESMHIVVRPVYGSAFPIAPGAVMAAGQLLTGRPWAGVWLGVGLMCAALCWMLQGWVSPGWALLGGVLAAFRFGVFSYWMNSYYGGAVAAAGGALVLGALPRILKRRRWPDAALMGAGVAILANSRPYEGAIFCLPLLAALAWRAPLWQHWRTTALPVVLVTGAAAIGLGYYCARFSGSPFRLPYSFYRSTVAMAPHFVFQSVRPDPGYHHRVLREFHTGWEMLCYSYARANVGPDGIFGKAKRYWRFYIGPFLTIPLIALPRMWRRRRVRLLVLTAGIMAAGLSVEVWQAPHYAAPATGLALLLVVEGLRHLRLGAGAWAVRAVVAGCLLTPVVGGHGTPVGDGSIRLAIQRQLEAAGGKHLVMVRYRLEHNVGDEWVYNEAGIDAAPVVWAREMDSGSNRKLARYFAGRRIWLAQPDTQPIALAPYDPAQPPDPPFRFVKLGTDAVDALRSPEAVRRNVLDRVAADCPGACLLTCDQWGYYFTAATGVETPDPAQGCFPAANRVQPIGVDEWFAWVLKQK